MELTRMTAAELSAALERKDVSATEVTRAHLDRIAAVDDRVHAFLHVAADSALEQARDIDARRHHGESLSPLAGVPVAVKDNIPVTGEPCRSGSAASSAQPRTTDHVVVQRLRDAGAVVVGLTRLVKLTAYLTITLGRLRRPDTSLLRPVAA
jgi:Asp-tRNA(Asn)/Glu-tRNA(Gln) amidotransferase A subunit family amidase